MPALPRLEAGRVPGRGARNVIEDVRRQLGDLATLAERVDRDEHRILEAARRRISEQKGAPDEAERAVLEQVIARAEAVLA